MVVDECGLGPGWYVADGHGDPVPYRVPLALGDVACMPHPGTYLCICMERYRYMCVVCLFMSSIL